MSRTPAAVQALLFAVALALAPAAVGQPDEEPDAQALEHWNDFMHYGLIARPELAAADGKALLEMQLDAQALLRVVEASRYDDRYPDDLATFRNMGGELAKTAADVADAVESARRGVARDPERIRESIEKLDDSLRARLNAIRRLRVAGEFAAPEMIHVIAGASDEDQSLRPYVLEAMVQLGRPMVLPMSEAMFALPPKPKAQVAQSLGRIGYPAALPFLLELAENEEEPKEVRQAAAAALQRIAERRGIPVNATAAELFLQLAESFYAGEPSLTLQPKASSNMVWYIDEKANAPDIDPVAVPTEVYPDVMAMRMARRALRLDPSLESALQLWLAANFRRENRLPGDAELADRVKPERSTAFYGRMAGPTHLKSVLARALGARDSALALDAIQAMRRTGGRQSLIDEAGVLLSAMNYPDTRVRLEAAIAVARANPTAKFPGSERVVPLLAEAANQTGEPRAVVVAADRNKRNEIAAKLRDMGNYRVHQADSLAALAGVMRDLPTADLVVVHGDAELLRGFRDGLAAMAKLQASPVVAMAPQGELATANAVFDSDRAVVVTPQSALADGRFAPAVEQAVEIVRGEPISEAQALANAERALDALRDLALMDNPLFDVTLAKAPLLEALASPEPAVAAGAASVLAWFEDAGSQEAVAEAAVKADQPEGQQVALLEALAESFKRNGNLTSDRLDTELRELVNAARGPVADAAAQAFGASDMPARQIVELITK